MSITLDLEPNLEARARARASAEGVPLEQYLQRVLERVLSSNSIQPHLGAEEFEHIMDELAAGSESEPIPPVVTRENIYAIAAPSGCGE